MESAWVILGFLALLIIAEALYKRWFISRSARTIPCQTPLPIIGNGLFFAKAKDLTQLTEAVRDYMPNQSIAGVWVFNKLLVMINDPHYIRELLSTRGCSSYKSPEIYGIFDEYSTGVFSRNGNEWARIRERLNKLMHPKHKSDWTKVFVERAKALSKTLRSMSSPADIYLHINKYTLAILCETIMGVSSSSTIQEVISDKFIHNMHQGIDTLFMTAVKIRHRTGFLYRLTQEWRNLKVITDEYRSVVNKTIRQRMNLVENLENNNEPRDVKESYIDLIIQTAKEEGINELQDIGLMTVDMFIAGSDTTTVAMTSALLFLAMHPEQQERAYEELHRIFGFTERDPVIEDLNKMEFLEMVILETLRLVGVPAIARTLQQAVDLDGFHLPKNTIVFFRLMKAHRNSSCWAKPEQFYPEHFAKDAVEKRPKGAFTPFGRGPRSCPGQLHAMLTMKVGLSTLIRRFRFSTHLKYAEIRYEYGFMLKPEKTDMSVHPRLPGPKKADDKIS